MTIDHTTKDALARHGLAPTKKRGQNFLVNPATAATIVRLGAFHPDDRVVEVGVGLGALTNVLARQVREVIGLEIDSGLIRYHRQEGDLADNVSLLHADVLKTDFDELARRTGSRLKIIANLPYSISNPFLFKLIDNRHLVDTATVMLQKEVAERLSARPGTKEYGVPTVLLGCCATIERLLVLKPAEFHPRPTIDSQVIRITFHEHEPQHCTFARLRTIVRTAFGNRRKTLLNNLSSPPLFGSGGDGGRTELKRRAEQVIRTAGLSPGVRAETLSVADFCRLAAAAESCSFS